MLDHLGIQCVDIEAGAAFYDAVLAPLGGKRVVEPAPGVIGYGVPPHPDFWISPLVPADAGFRENHVAFVADTRAAVDAFYAAAVEAVQRFCTHRANGRSTTPATTARSCAIPTATTSRRSATAPSDGVRSVGAA